jgi:hypothetical protein
VVSYDSNATAEGRPTQQQLEKSAMRWAEQEAGMTYGIELDVLPKNWYLPNTGY